LSFVVALALKGIKKAILKKKKKFLFTFSNSTSSKLTLNYIEKMFWFGAIIKYFKIIEKKF
jgi:hypothetical protein